MNVLLELGTATHPRVRVVLCVRSGSDDPAGGLVLQDSSSIGKRSPNLGNLAFKQHSRADGSRRNIGDMDIRGNACKLEVFA